MAQIQQKKHEPFQEPWQILMMKHWNIDMSNKYDLECKNEMLTVNSLVSSIMGNENKQDSFPELVSRKTVDGHVSKISP